MADTDTTRTDEELETTEEETTEAPKAKGKEYSKDDIASLIEKARKEEKDKLYGVISDLKTQVENLSESQKREAEEKARIQKEAELSAEKERLAKLSAEEQIAESVKKIEEKLALEEKARQELEHQLQHEREQRELEAFKAQLLQEAGDDIIPDLVQGATKEELKESTARAKARFQELFNTATEKAKGNRSVRENMPGPTDPDPAAFEEAELRKQLATMEVDTDRYFGNRLKGISRDQSYINEVNVQRAELRERLEKLYRSGVVR